jgi:glycerophosphoryl diester phosphodiesterase
MKTTLKIAHRGYVANCKENTLEAFQNAIQYNFDMIEMDVQLCKDDTIIVYHDTYLGTSMVEELTFEEVQQKDPDILSLREFFTLFNYKFIPIILDMKGSDALAHSLCSFIIDNSIDTTHIYFASFNGNHLDYLAGFPLKLGYLCENKLDLQMINYLIQKYQPSFFALAWTNIDAEHIHYIHSQHKLVFSYTVENKTVSNYLKQLNLDGFISKILIS